MLIEYFSPVPGRYLDMKNSETLRALMEENETNNKKSAQRDARGLKEARPAAPVKMVASNPHFKVCYTLQCSFIAMVRDSNS